MTKTELIYHIKNMGFPEEIVSFNSTPKCEEGYFVRHIDDMWEALYFEKGENTLLAKTKNEYEIYDFLYDELKRERELDDSSPTLSNDELISLFNDPNEKEKQEAIKNSITNQFLEAVRKNK